jgi:hypothetical protein
MTQGFVQVAVDGSGKQLGNEVYTVPIGTQLTDGSGNVTTISAPLYFFREHIINADPTNPAGVATVTNAQGPGVSDFGLTVRMPQGQPDLSAMLAVLLDIDANIAQLAGNAPLVGGAPATLPQYGLPVITALQGGGVSPSVPQAVGVDRFGRQIILPHTVRDLTKSVATTITVNTETTIIPASGDQVNCNDVIAIIASNTSATAVRVDIRDQLSTVASPLSKNGVIPLYVPAGDVRGISLGGVIIPQSNVNQVWTATVSSAVTDIRIWALYAVNPR